MLAGLRRLVFLEAESLHPCLYGSGTFCMKTAFSVRRIRSLQSHGPFSDVLLLQPGKSGAPSTCQGLGRSRDLVLLASSLM